MGTESGAPSAVPTVEPTDAPSVVPTLLPTAVESDAPSSVPTVEPTDAPTNVPIIDSNYKPSAEESTCKDVEGEFFVFKERVFKNKKKKDCSWVAKKTENRCDMFLENKIDKGEDNCPKTCGTCDPSSVDESACADVEGKFVLFKERVFKNKKKKDCGWVAEKTKNRCEMFLENEVDQGKDSCPKACGKCDVNDDGSNFFLRRRVVKK